MGVSGKRYLRQAAYRGFEFKRWVLVFGIALLIAVGQGLYELHEKDRSVSESLKAANWTWFWAVVITLGGLLLTSEFLWKLFHGPRATEAQVEASLRMAALSCNLGRVANVRATVFVAYRRGDERVLFQEFPYIYAHYKEGDYGVGRHGISEAIGIVGHLLRRKRDSLGVFLDNSSEEEFRRLLVESPWNFPIRLADKVNIERANYMAFRFVRPGRRGGEPLEGVLYFDARGHEPLFTHDTLGVILVEQIDAIVDFVAEHFRKGRGNGQED